jgi:hypothetical protein
VAASNKPASVVILKQSLSTLTYAVTNWWPAGPPPVALHYIFWWQLLWDTCYKVTRSNHINHHSWNQPHSTLTVVFRLTSKSMSETRGDHMFRPSRRSALIEGFGKGSRTHRVDILSSRALRTCRRNHFYSSLFLQQLRHCSLVLVSSKEGGVVSSE